MDKELNELTEILNEAGIKTNSQFFKNRKNRLRLYKSNPDAFLTVSKNGTPVFPVRDQYNAMSLSVLKRTLGNAKRLYRQTECPRYKEFIDKIELYLKTIENKALIIPIGYKVNGDLQDILDKSRDLGSLSSLGNNL